MEPIKFKQHNVVIAENQPQYIPLPAQKRKDGNIISCWKFTFSERLRILFGENLYLSILTGGGNIQPQRPTIGYPEHIYTFWDDIDEDGNKTGERAVKEKDLTEEEKSILKVNNIPYG